MSIRRLLLVPLFAVLGLLAFVLPAQAKVTIVPGAGKAGEIVTFAFRLANQQPNTDTVRLELVFPQDKPIGFAEVDPVNGWTASIIPRTLPAPIQIGGQTVTEVVGSIVLHGGSVGPNQFEQFLITLGPLPADGTLSFDATQGYADGRTERWTGADAPGITIMSGGSVAGGSPVIAGVNDGSTTGSAEGRTSDSDEDDLSFTLIWVALGLGAVVVAFVGIHARLRARRLAADARDAPAATQEESAPTEEDKTAVEAAK